MDSRVSLDDVEKRISNNAGESYTLHCPDHSLITTLSYSSYLQASHHFFFYMSQLCENS